MPSSASHSPKPRTPGMSMMWPPPGRSMIWRETVVCRPLPSLRTSVVFCTWLPTSMFTKLDLPTPLRPMSTAVLSPSAMACARRCTDSGLRSDTARSSSLPTKPSMRRRTSSTSSAEAIRSALVSTTITWAPVSCANTSSRSSRRMFTSSMGCATTTKSKLAASVWGRARSVGSLRTKQVRRASVSSMIPLSCPSGRETRTRSPTTARLSLPFTSEMACSQRTSSPLSKRTRG